MTYSQRLDENGHQQLSRLCNEAPTMMSKIGFRLFAATLLLGPSTLQVYAAEKIELLVGYVHALPAISNIGTIAVGNSEIVDPAVLGAGVATLNAKNVGKTNVIVFDSNNKAVASYDVEVVPHDRREAFTVRVVSGAGGKPNVIELEYGCGPGPGCTLKPQRPVTSTQTTVTSTPNGTTTGTSTSSTATESAPAARP